VPREVREFSPEIDPTWPAGFDAVLLLSDGRFEAPVVAPPTYAVIDPALDETRDARVQRMEVHDSTVDSPAAARAATAMVGGRVGAVGGMGGAGSLVAAG
jgi:hypothetical protein